MKEIIKFREKINEIENRRSIPASGKQSIDSLKILTRLTNSQKTDNKEKTQISTISDEKWV